MMTRTITPEQELRDMSQADRVRQMRADLEKIGGNVVRYEALPVHIEEELLRQSLGYSTPFGNV